jgi:hypothetical protein
VLYLGYAEGLGDVEAKGTAVLVSELGRVPKFAHMAPGALAWARERAPR